MAKKNGKNWILEYYQKTKDGSLTVGRYMELELEYLIKGLEEKLFFYDQKKANNAVEWIEKHAFHTEGPLAPGPLKLELWQKAFISALFGIVNDKGLRQFREAVLVIGRKNGKSLIAAAIAKYVWMVDGGFGAKVFNIAPKLDQADIIYNNIWQMVLLDPEYQKMKEKYADRDQHNKKILDDSDMPKHRQTDLSILKTNSTVKKIAFSAKKSDGFNPSLCVCDEIAAWQGDPGLKQYEVMKSGMGARPEGILLSCTTSGYVNDGIYDELVKRCTRFVLGESKETKLLPFLYIIDDVEKWNDINELRKSNPNLGVSVPVDYMIEEIAVAYGSASKKSEFLTKYACIKQNSSMAWLDSKTVEKCFGEPLKIEDFCGSYAVCGIDLSQTTDLTAAVLVIQKNEDLFVFAKFFLPGAKIQEATERDGLPYKAYIDRGILVPSGDNFVDYADCYQWMCSLIEQYQIYPLMTGYDRYSSQYLVKELNQYGFHTDDVWQGHNLYPVLMEIEGLMKDGRIHCGDNDLLKVHMLNSAIKMEVDINRGKLVKIAPNEHIDGMAALADAMTVRQKHWASLGDRLVNEE